MSIRRLQRRLLRGRWSFASQLLLAWLVLSIAVVLSPCCEGITSLFSVPAAHAGVGPADDAAGHDHAPAGEHALCAPALDDALEVLPGAASRVSPAPPALVFFIGLAATALVAPFTSSAGPPLPARSPLYLRLGRLLN